MLQARRRDCDRNAVARSRASVVKSFRTRDPFPRRPRAELGPRQTIRATTPSVLV
jgi:hypothetical protein